MCRNNLLADAFQPSTPDGNKLVLKLQRLELYIEKLLGLGGPHQTGVDERDDGRILVIRSGKGLIFKIPPWTKVVGRLDQVSWTPAKIVRGFPLFMKTVVPGFLHMLGRTQVNATDSRPAEVEPTGSQEEEEEPQFLETEHADKDRRIALAIEFRALDDQGRVDAIMPLNDSLESAARVLGKQALRQEEHNSELRLNLQRYKETLDGCEVEIFETELSVMDTGPSGVGKTTKQDGMLAVAEWSEEQYNSANRGVPDVTLACVVRAAIELNTRKKGMPRMPTVAELEAVVASAQWFPEPVGGETRSEVKDGEQDRVPHCDIFKKWLEGGALEIDEENNYMFRIGHVGATTLFRSDRRFDRKFAVMDTMKTDEECFEYMKYFFRELEAYRDEMGDVSVANPTSEEDRRRKDLQQMAVIYNAITKQAPELNYNSIKLADIKLEDPDLLTLETAKEMMCDEARELIELGVYLRIGKGRSKLDDRVAIRKALRDEEEALAALEVCVGTQGPGAGRPDCVKLQRRRLLRRNQAPFFPDEICRGGNTFIDSPGNDDNPQNQRDAEALLKAPEDGGADVINIVLDHGKYFGDQTRTDALRRQEVFKRASCETRQTQHLVLLEAGNVSSHAVADLVDESSASKKNKAASTFQKKLKIEKDLIIMSHWNLEERLRKEAETRLGQESHMSQDDIDNEARRLARD